MTAFIQKGQENMKRDLILPRHNETSSDNQAINVSKMFGLVTKFL